MCIFLFRRHKTVMMKIIFIMEFAVIGPRASRLSGLGNSRWAYLSDPFPLTLFLSRVHEQFRVHNLPELSLQPLFPHLVAQSGS